MFVSFGQYFRRRSVALRDDAESDVGFQPNECSSGLRKPDGERMFTNVNKDPCSAPPRTFLKLCVSRAVRFPGALDSAKTSVLMSNNFEKSKQNF